jgi:hypothetical protein
MVGASSRGGGESGLLQALIESATSPATADHRRTERTPESGMVVLLAAHYALTEAGGTGGAGAAVWLS